MRLVLTIEGDQSALERLLHVTLALAAQLESACSAHSFQVVAVDCPVWPCCAGVGQDAAQKVPNGRS